MKYGRCIVDVVIAAKLLIFHGDMRRHVASHDFRTAVRAKHRSNRYSFAHAPRYYDKKTNFLSFVEMVDNKDLFRSKNYSKVGIQSKFDFTMSLDGG